jgi:4-amino-4-deoxy-L-arabinose transferase-like glycosyltransferase
VDDYAVPVATATEAPPWRVRLIGLALLVAGAGLQFLIMASDERFSFSVPLGFASCTVAALGLLLATGGFTFQDQPAHSLDVRQLRRPALMLLLSLAALVVVLRAAVLGVIPYPIVVCAVLIPALFLWVVITAFGFARHLGAFGPEENGEQLPLHRRHGFWLVALISLLYLPLLGSYSLIDPWETHYGEVAREMLARDDWISLWWAQDGWFWSKPILDFWLQGLSFSLLGVRYAPDQMLAGIELGRWPAPEWAARFPIFIVTLLGAYVLYRSSAKFFGRRAAFFGGLVLMTVPYWLLIARQTMTDMPYVATLTAGLGFLSLGLLTRDDARARLIEVRLPRMRLKVTAMHLVLVAVLVSALPQVLYLTSRNVTLHWDRKDSVEEQTTKPSLSVIDLIKGKAVPRGFRAHADEVNEGSGGGNCGLPGNNPCRAMGKLHNPRFQPALAGLLYSVLLGALVWANRRETRLSRVFFLAAWYAIALATMAKGAPGLVLPVFVFGAYIALRNDWKQLARADLGALLLILVCVCLPWFIQMYMRHGPAFVDRLLWHDMYKRAFEHVHDTNQGDDISFRYYVWQLGYGLFPWNGVCAAGLVWWFRRERAEADRTHQAALVLFLWAIATFGMFTVTLTKFHHYILPMVPPVAALSGLLLAEALGPASERPAPFWRTTAYYGSMALGVALATLGVALSLPGTLLGKRAAEVAGPRPILGACLLLLGVVALVLSALRLDPARGDVQPPPQADTGRDWTGPLLGVIGLIGASAALLAGRDMAMSKAGDVTGSIRLMHLFTYQYKRPWPDSLDFRPTLLAFALVTAVLFLGWLVRRLRPHAVVGMCSLALVFAVWTANVYLVRTAPHWGQRETMIAYYQSRNSPEELLVAFQMNWKGENFYTGNRIPAFVSTGKKFKSWLEDRKAEGTKVMYFTTETARLKGLKRELDDPAQFEVLTDEDLNNKFFLAKVTFE